MTITDVIALGALIATIVGFLLAHTLTDARSAQRIEDHIVECDKRYQALAGSILKLDHKLDSIMHESPRRV